ncbi:GGDEF domain-containing protein [Cellulomonas endophytica]|uniref:GGDEF domain-containing protein n=1 Tax=Cellulomonas endophytica TaxID=2494735 RepID=UPI0013E928FD|nr:GGDEF domain-containing protein [Cellulomonas endophytica]
MSAPGGLVLDRLSLSSASWWATVGVGIPLLGVALVRDGVDLLGLGGPLVMIACLLLVLEVFPVVVSGRLDPQGVVVSTAFTFALLFLWGLWPALVVQSLATVASELRKRKPLRKLLFNVAQYNVSFAAAWVVVRLAGHAPTVTGEAAALGPGDAWWVVLAWVVYFWVNNALVSAVLSGEESFVGLLLEDLLYYVGTTFPVLALSPVVVVVAVHAWPTLPLLVVPLTLMYVTAGMVARAEHLATHDTLTGLANRARFHTVLRDALAAGDRTGAPCALLLIDLDRFKEVNDRWGHAAGDALLVAFAGRLRLACREEDLPVRLGGDEFAVVLPGADADGGRAVAGRLLALLAEPVVVGGDVPELHVHASVGVAARPEHADDEDALLRLADLAMYVAKKAGTDVEVYSGAAERYAGESKHAPL